MITLTRAIEIACDAHKSQKDKGGFSYIHHPINVMMAIKDDGGSEDDMIVAVLHDVVEDSDWTIGTLRKEGLTEYQLAAIDALTKTDKPIVNLSVDEKYDEYIGRIMRNELAKRVKIKDIEHNMDIRRLKGGANLKEKDLNRIAKYKKTYDRLTGRA